MADGRLGCACGREALLSREETKVVDGVVHRHSRPCYAEGGSKQVSAGPHLAAEVRPPVIRTGPLGLPPGMRLMEDLARSISATQRALLEGMARAFCADRDLPPEAVELVEDRGDSTRTRWWMRERAPEVRPPEPEEQAAAAVEETLARWREGAASALRLRSGRVLYASHGILGLTAGGRDARTLFQGYDGVAFIEGADEPEALTPDERAEVAAAMVELWRRWAKGDVEKSVDSVDK